MSWRPIEEAPLRDGVQISAAWFDTDDPVGGDARPEHIEEGLNGGRASRGGC